MVLRRNTRSTLLVGLGLLGLPLLTACPVPSGSSHSLTVDPGLILAADAKPGSFDYWIIDPSDGSIDSSGSFAVTAGLGAQVTVTADDALGIYVTTPSYVSAPDYTVKLQGSMQDDAPFSYLDTEEDAFEDLRASANTAEMVTKHDQVTAASDQIRANWALDQDLQAEALITLAYEQVTGTQALMQDGVLVLTDSSDLDAAENETSGMASWATDVESELGLIEAQALADSSLASSESAALEASAPDPAALQAAIEACLDELEGFGDEIEATADQYFPDVAGDDYDGRKVDGEMTDQREYEKEVAFESYLARQESDLIAIEDCVEEAIGAEPVVDPTLADETPYMDMGNNAEGSAATGEALATVAQGDVESQYGGAMDGDGGASWGVVGWRAPADAADNVIQAVVGADMFAESGGGASPAPSGSATSKENSSAGACMGTTPVFDVSLAGVGIIVGTPFDDVIRGGDNASGFEVMWGGKGNDCMNGLKGHELIMGGPGNDEIHGGDQHELLLGGSGDDLIYAGEGASYSFTIFGVEVELDLGSVVFGGRGNDVISGSDPDYDDTDLTEFGYTDIIFGDGLTAATAGNDTIDGGAGIDFLFGQWGDDTMVNLRPGSIDIDSVPLPIGSFHFGGQGDDTLTGSPRFDLMIGSKHDDTINGMGGLDLVFGCRGDDILDGGDNLDLVFGGKGDDIVNGGSGFDLVVGNSGDDILDGGPGGLDLVLGGSGDDTASGGEGFDIALGGSGRDFVNGNDGLDLAIGGSDNDTVSGGEGIDLVIGGAGRDWVQGDAGAVDLVIGGAETDVVIGGDGMDVLLGNGGDDWMDGEDGIDIAFASDGDDVIFGGAGAVDLLMGADGNDCIWGEDGLNVIFGSDGDDQIVGGADLDVLLGNGDSDTLFGNDGIGILVGGDGDDRVQGGVNLDVILGGAGADTLHGGATLDLFFGGSESDCMSGDEDFDVSLGGDGDDLALSMGAGLGGSGADDIETTMVGIGGDGEDIVSQTGTTLALLMGGSDSDHLYLSPTGALGIALGGSGDDDISATGSTSQGASSTTRAFVFGGTDSDFIQASRGKDFAFGQKGDDTMSGDTDGSGTNDDKKDRHWGNSDVDTMYGDGDNKKDKLRRGTGDDPSRSTDDWPSGWGAVHAAPSFSTCAALPVESQCDAMVEPPQDVGAK